ncbi:pyridoxamine 5'-phosphate oxidase family protein [Streptomyces albus]|uniref:pyridoxamine 5'-phosphate oxidase family protein n=1 Tax=Streptomyces albus TaxID=1888 RepID=UPI003B985B54
MSEANGHGDGDGPTGHAGHARYGPPPPRRRPGSDGEHALQERIGSQNRANRFYDDQVLDHLNARMRDFVGRQEMFFLATADRNGECDNSFRAGPPGFLRVLDERTLVFPEYRGNGVHASLGNIQENPHAGLILIDFLRARIGLHINGRAEVLDDAELRPWVPDLPEDPVPGRRAVLWVRIDVEEAYIHCAKHIPHLQKAPRRSARDWGTDDYKRKGGDFFGAARDAREARKARAANESEPTRTTPTTTTPATPGPAAPGPAAPGPAAPARAVPTPVADAARAAGSAQAAGSALTTDSAPGTDSAPTRDTGPTTDSASVADTASVAGPETAAGGSPAAAPVTGAPPVLGGSPATDASPGTHPAPATGGRPARDAASAAEVPPKGGPDGGLNGGPNGGRVPSVAGTMPGPGSDAGNPSATGNPPAPAATTGPSAQANTPPMANTQPVVNAPDTAGSPPSADAAVPGGRVPGVPTPGWLPAPGWPLGGSGAAAGGAGSHGADSDAAVTAAGPPPTVPPLPAYPPHAPADGAGPSAPSPAEPGPPATGGAPGAGLPQEAHRAPVPSPRAVPSHEVAPVPARVSRGRHAAPSRPTRPSAASAVSAAITARGGAVEGGESGEDGDEDVYSRHVSAWRREAERALAEAQRRGAEMESERADRAFQGWFG